jgi:hypothetical protein
VSLEAACAGLARAGLNLVGTLTPDEYDRLVPEVWSLARVAPASQGVLVVGNAGRALWPLFRASPEARLRRDPLDRYTERVLREVAGMLPQPASVALYRERRDQQYLPLVRLAERAGFGSPGRVGVLLHPVYGPWISIRGVLFAGFRVPFRKPEPFDPCTGCPAPCAVVCHGQVIGPRGVDVEGCFRTKLLERACRAACDARSACVLGPEHAFAPEQIAHHSRIRWRPSTLRRAAATLLSRSPTTPSGPR